MWLSDVSVRRPVLATVLSLLVVGRVPVMPLVTAAQEAGVHFMGGPVFIYDGAMGDPDQPFKLTTGFPVAPGTEAVDGAVIEELPAVRVASVYYTGPVEHLQEAYQALFPALFRAGLRPAGVSREVYLHWVDEDSPNNVIEVQAVLAE